MSQQVKEDELLQDRQNIQNKIKPLILTENSYSEFYKISTENSNSDK